MRWFPSRQVHLGLCAISAALWERFATDLDRRDSNRKWGPAFRVHRGFTHSVWFSLAFGLLWWLVLAVLGIWVPWNVAAALFGGADVPLVIGASMALGCLAHIAGDGCTDFGISPFAPVLLIDGRRYPRLALLPEPLRFKVNKKVELWLIAPLCSGLVGYSVLAALFGPVAVLVTAWQLLSALWVGLA